VETAVGVVRPKSQWVDRIKESSPHVVIATPRTAHALLAAGALKLNKLSTLVLDEADLLLDVSESQPLVKELLQRALGSPKSSSSMQLLLVSATVTPQVVQMCIDNGRNAPRQVTSCGAPHSDAPQSAAGQTMEASLGQSGEPPRFALPQQLRHLAVQVPRAQSHQIQNATYARFLAKIHATLQPKGAVLAFISDEAAAPGILEGLQRRNFRASAMTATLPKERKARAALLRKVKSGRVQFLLTTEMGARGLDLGEIAVVVNTHPPKDSRQYLHRAGRAGRLHRSPGQADAKLAGPAETPEAAPGTVVTMIMETDDGTSAFGSRGLQKITNELGMELQRLEFESPDTH